MRDLYGGIEGGGTKFVCMVAGGPQNIVDQIRFPTTTPEETFRRVVDFFIPHLGRLQAIGLACFGPLDIDPESPTYGYVTATPKPGWSNINVLDMLKLQLQLPVAIDLDVNAAVLGEFCWGAAQGLDPCLYLTVGTGIGGGYLIRGRPLTGLSNLEMGHIRLRRDPQRDPFPGACPFHGDCFEGLAAGPAIRKRLGIPAEDLPQAHSFWNLEAEYIAQALATFVLALSPRRIILGGGVMQNPLLFPLVRHGLLELLGSYVPVLDSKEKMEAFVVPPGLGGLSGVLGAIALAQNLAGSA